MVHKSETEAWNVWSEAMTNLQAASDHYDAGKQPRPGRWLHHHPTLPPTAGGIAALS
jgi:hypothetical protein